MLIPKTRREIWLNRLRVWLPPLFVAVALIARRPAWHLWGLPLVIVGEALRTWAAGHLLKDERLTVGGPYAHVRNPLYVGSLLSGLGLLAIVGDPVLAAFFLAIALAVYLPTIRQEEDYLRRMHGEAFDEYRRAVPALVPRLGPATFGRAGGGGQASSVRARGFAWRRVWLNQEHRTWLALAVLFGLLAARTWWPQ